MNILLIHTADYLHHEQTSRQHAIFELLADKHDVYVLHFHVSRAMGRGTRCYIVEATRYDTQNPVLHYTLNAPYHYQVISDLIREVGIDVIVTSNVLASTAAILAARNQNIPVVFDVSDWLPDSAAAYAGNKILKKIVRTVVFWITKWNLHHSTRVITVSPSLKKRLEGLGIAADIITNGVYTDTFFPMPKETAKRVFGLDGSFVIGFAGAMEGWYDIESMIRAMPELLKEYPDTKLFLVGGSLFTDYEKKLRKLAFAHNIYDKVIFNGFVQHNQLPAFIAAMDICAIPLVPPEWAQIALPNKYFEYAAMGKPILMTPIPDVVKIGKNLYVYRNQREYITAIRHFRTSGIEEIPNPDLSEYSWKRKAEQFEDLLWEVIK